MAYVVLRGDSAHHLTRAGVDRARWTGLEGRRVVVALINVRSWNAGVGELVGRLLADAGAADVQVQAQGEIAARFTADAERGASEYRAVLR